MQLGERLRELRQQRQMTLLDVAKATSLSVSYLSDLERNRTKPSLDALERLARSYAISLADLLMNVDAPSTEGEGLAPGLESLVRENKIDPDMARELSRIQFRGKRPQEPDDWYELYLYLRRIMRPYLSEQERGGKGE